MSVVGKYAEFAVSCRTKGHSEDVLHHAKRALIDWFACTLPGGLEEPAVLMTKALHEIYNGQIRLEKIVIILYHPNMIKYNDYHTKWKHYFPTWAKLAKHEGVELTWIEMPHLIDEEKNGNI